MGMMRQGSDCLGMSGNRYPVIWLAKLVLWVLQVNLRGFHMASMCVACSDKCQREKNEVKAKNRVLPQQQYDNSANPVPPHDRYSKENLFAWQA